MNELPIGIKLVFFDGEECTFQYGEHDGLWGSRFQAENWEKSGLLKNCRGMILLDMVGDKDLAFTVPQNVDPELRKWVWEEVGRLKYEKHLTDFHGEILDDHVPFLEKGIPALVLIDFLYGPGNSYWHTPQDQLDKLSKESLKCAGDLALAVVWRIAGQ